MTKTRKSWKLYISPDPRIAGLLCQMKQATRGCTFDLRLAVVLPQGFANPGFGRFVHVSIYQLTLRDNGAKADFKAIVTLMRRKTHKGDQSHRGRYVERTYQLTGELARDGGWRGAADIYRVQRTTL